MEELIELVMEKTGLPEDQAKQAVETVLTFLKQKLPAPLAGQIDAALKNETMMQQASDALEKGASMLDGLLKKK